jgi:FKBP-type peptidyl-prolyl cis-trans isomerase SlyD
MQVEKNKVIGISYRLKADNGETGMQPWEEVPETAPFLFLVGTDSVFPKFEEALIGKSIGDEFSVFIDFDNAYGDYYEERKTVIPKSNFKQQGTEKREPLKVGKVVPMQDEKGNQIKGEIIKINYLGVHMDFNPPLAGYDLSFEGKIISIRDAEPEEITHGHVHGLGGQNH